MDSAPLERRKVPVHFLPDSQRLLQTHGVWSASWDASNNGADNEPATFNDLAREAFDLYAAGKLPIEVRWELAERYPDLPARLLSRAQRRAESDLCAAETAPPELRRAMVAAARQKAIQGALAAGQWGAAMRGLDRAGEIAGELRESAGLGDEDLTLSVVVEPGVPPLPGHSGALGHSGETTETAGETGSETD